MTQNAESLIAKTPEQGFLAAAAGEAADFGEGIFHGAVENPINGTVQLANHLSGAHLPEIHLVDEERIDHSVAGRLGSMVGTAADFYALSLATGGLGGAGYLAVGLRMGIVGAAVGVFQPSDPDSKSFFADRAVNASVSAATLGSFGLAAAGLNELGVFAVPAARSLTGSLTYGALIGAAAGVGHSEANAILRKGEIVPKFSDLLSDMESFTAFGATYGAIGYGVNSFTGPPPQHFETPKGTADVFSDQGGNPVRVNTNMQALNDSYTNVNMQVVKMTDGTWSTRASADDGSSVLPSNTDSVIRSPDGSITMTGTNWANHDIVRRFDAAGTYTRQDLTQQAQDAEDKIRIERLYGKTVTDDTSTRQYTPDGKLRQFHLVEESGYPKTGASIFYAKDGAVEGVSIRSAGEPELTLSRTDQGGFNLQMNNQLYTWNGAVKVVPAVGANGLEHIEFTPAGGQPATYGLDTGTRAVADMAAQTATYVPGAMGPVVKVDAQGQVQITDTASSDRLLVNGNPIPRGEAVSINLGDQVALKLDVGDRYPIWRTIALPLTTNAQGEQTLGGMLLKANTTSDYSLRAPGNIKLGPPD